MQLVEIRLTSGDDNDGKVKVVGERGRACDHYFRRQRRGFSLMCEVEPPSGGELWKEFDA